MIRLGRGIYEAVRRLPPVTGALLATISVVFVLETLAGGANHAHTLIGFGASLRPYFLDGEYWRLVMPMFIHLSIMHLLLNAAALFIFGPPLETLYGGRRFALIYLAGGMSGSLASMALSRQLGAGASGAIMGVCGALAVTGYKRPWALGAELPPKCREQMLAAIALTLAVGVWMPHIDNWAHTGGLVAGVVLALVMPLPSAIERVAARLGWSLTLPLCVVCFSMTAAINYYGLSRQVIRLEAAGRRFLVKGNARAAAAVFEEAALIEPADERAYEALGRIYISEKRWQSAISEYRQALAVAQDVAGARVRLAAAYFDAGDARRAAAAEQMAIREAPHNPEYRQRVPRYFHALTIHKRSNAAE